MSKREAKRGQWNEVAQREPPIYEWVEFQTYEPWSCIHKAMWNGKCWSWMAAPLGFAQKWRHIVINKEIL